MIQEIQKQKNIKKGFVMLFAVTLSALVLAIALGITNIALKEVKFGTSAKDTNDAFFAADSGLELVLYNVDVEADYPSDVNTPVFVPALGSGGGGCAQVTVDKTALPATKIISKGYNIRYDDEDGTEECLPGPSNVERQIEINY